MNDDKNIPDVVRTPPIKVVVRKPNLSTKIPEIGENKNVAPIVRDPTRAGKRRKRIKLKKIEFFHESKFM